MKKKNEGLFNKVMDFAEKNSRAILTGLSLTGLVTTSVLAARAGKNVPAKIKKAKEDLKICEKDDKIAKRAVIKQALLEIAPDVIPPIIMGAATAGCILGNHKVTSKKIAVLSAAYSLSENALGELNNKLEEVVGERKATEIRDGIKKDKLKKDFNPAEANTIVLGEGDVLCKDLVSGRYFKSNSMKMQQAINELSHDLRNNLEMSLNELYDAIGLDTIPLGEDLGWTVEQMERGSIPVDFTTCLTEDNRPCLCLDIHNLSPLSYVRSMR